ncbi:MAG: ABC transporter permease [Thermoleophilia bacterium]|nr:ABC transporter permease [Thermoleophilia bacterium]
MTRAQAVSGVFVVLVLAFLFTPVVVVVLFSFNGAASTSLPLESLSLRWYDAAFSNPVFRDALRNSIYVAGVTALAVAVLGTNASFALTRRPSRLLNLFSSFIVTPLVVPGLFLGVALLVFYDRIEFRRSLTTVIIGHVLITLPFVVLIVNARLMRLDRSIEEAARDLGATPLQAFRKIVFPLIRPALVGSILIAVAWSFDEFIITFFTIGGEITLPIMIWGMLRRGLDPSVNAIASVILATTVLATVVAARLLSARGFVP